MAKGKAAASDSTCRSIDASSWPTVGSNVQTFIFGYPWSILLSFMAYRLENDFDYCEDDPASIRAARNPNPLVLISVLKEATRLTNALRSNQMFRLSQINRNYSANTYVCGALYCIYNSPLTAATEACLPKMLPFCWQLVLIPTVYGLTTWTSTRCASYGAEIQRMIHIASANAHCEPKSWQKLGMTSHKRHL